MDTIVVEIEHVGYWRGLVARLRELAQECTPRADEKRAEIEAEMAAVFMQLVEAETSEGVPA